MAEPFRPVGLTFQVRVSDMSAGEAFYARLLKRPPNLVATESFKEWELTPGSWLQVAEGTPTIGSGPLRMGVSDIEAERARVERELGIEVSQVERIEGLSAWCNFSDPFGNRLGFFQDLAVK